MKQVQKGGGTDNMKVGQESKKQQKRKINEKRRREKKGDRRQVGKRIKKVKEKYSYMRGK